MFLKLLLFAVGFYILIKGADILIKGSSSLARLFKVSSWIIGLVIVGIGTSIPEFSIGIASVLDGADVGVGTIIGSATFNILFILGLASFFGPVIMRKVWVVKDFSFNAIAVLISGILAFSFIVGNSEFGGITKEEGLILLLLFIIWFGLEVKHSGVVPEEEDEEAAEEVFTTLTSLTMVIGGIIGVFLGGKWVVEGAEFLAGIFGASETLVGLTVVGIGTSIPELTVTMTALKSRQTGIAVGNLIGSNIFNFLAIFGIISLFAPVGFPSRLVFDFLVLLTASLLLLAFMFIGARYTLKRWQGTVFLLFYFSYILLIFFRG